MENKIRWQQVIIHYEQLISEGFDFVPQLDIARKIVDSNYVESLFPTLSHDALNISRVKDFYLSFDHPSICIQYVGNKKFKVSYSPKLNQTHDLSKHTCCYENLWSYLESLFLRQKIESGL